MVPRHALLSICFAFFATTVLARDASFEDEKVQSRHQLRRLRSRRHTSNSDYNRGRVIIRIQDEHKRATEINDEDVPDWLREELNELLFEDRFLQFSSSLELSTSLQFSTRLDANINESAPPAMNPTSSPSLAPSWIPSDLPSLLPSSTPISSPSSSPSTSPSNVPSPTSTMLPFDWRLPLTESPSASPTVQPVLVLPVTEAPSTIPTLQPFDMRLGAVPTETPTLPVQAVEARIEKKDHLDERIAEGDGATGKGKSRKATGDRESSKGGSASLKGKSSKSKRNRRRVRRGSKW